MDSTILANRAMPNFVKENAPLLLELFKEFLNYSNSSGAFFDITNLVSNHDIDTVIDEYLYKFKYLLMEGFPSDTSANIRLLMKVMLRLYQSRGSYQSFEFFFRALYDSDVSISLPKENIIRASDGKWKQPTYLKLEGMETYSDLGTVNGYKCTGMTSNAYGYVGLPISIAFDGASTTEPALEVEMKYSEFIVGEDLFFSSVEFPLVFTHKILSKVKSSGYYDGTDGLLSMDKVIQDSYFYQDFSYVITSSVPLEIYEEFIKTIVHPAGFLFFGNLQHYSDSDVMYVDQVEFIRYWLLVFCCIYLFNPVDCESKFKLKFNTSIKKETETVDDIINGFTNWKITEDFDDISPSFLDVLSNQSSHLVFNYEGLLIHPQSITWNGYGDVQIGGLINSCISANFLPCGGMTVSYCYDGTINVLEEDFYDSVLLFVNGKYCKEYTTGENSYLVDESMNGEAIIYKINNSSFKTVLEYTTNSTGAYNIPKEIKKQKILPFLDGRCVYNEVNIEGSVVYLDAENGLQLDIFILNKSPLYFVDEIEYNGSEYVSINNKIYNNVMKF